MNHKLQTFGSERADIASCWGPDPSFAPTWWSDRCMGLRV